MSWLDIILDHISQFGFSNITKLEKQYLKNYQTDLEEEIEQSLNDRFEFYKTMYYYNIEDAFWTTPDYLVIVTDEDIKQTRLNMLWDNIEVEDSESFMKIFKVPNKYIDMDWTELPERIRDKFEKYWEQYYNFEVI